MPLFKQILSPTGLLGWKGGRRSWGNHKIDLKPTEGTNSLNRTGLHIHGGAEFGSGGCVDLANGMDDFTNKFVDYGQDMMLQVKYPKKCW